MKPLQTLLVATDFAADAVHALERGALVAAAHGARLRALHVLPRPALQTLQGLLSRPQEAEAALVADASAALAAWAARLAPQDVETLVAAGHVVDEVVAAAATADLLLLGAHGQSPLRDFILGTTAERLLRRVDVPVLVVRRAPAGGWRRVLVPLDLTGDGLPALELALRVAPGAEVTPLHVYDVPFEGKLRLAGVDDDELRAHAERTQREAAQALAGLVGRCADAARLAPPLVQRGDAAARILETARGDDSDLVVIGPHAHGALDRLLGSVARHVLADVECDVLVAPPASRP